MSDRMYILVNEDLGMSRGKIAAQVAHAVARVKIKEPPETMIVLSAGTEQLHNLKTYLEDKSIHCHLYIDEGVNEIPPYSVTALAVVPLSDESIDELAIFKDFKLLRDKRWWQQ